jgi:hypothetical protein
VGRKLLILARELDLQNEFEEIDIQNLRTEHLREGSAADFLTKLKEFDAIYDKIKSDQNQIMCCVTLELSGDLT